MMKKYVLLVPVIALAGCSMVPGYTRPEVGFSNQWQANALPQGAATNEAMVSKDWWTLFGSVELTSLVNAALAQNNDLVAAAERVAQARGTLRVASANLLPGVSAGASTDYNKADVHRGGTSSSSANVTASYELDLFGANRASRSAAKAALAAAGYDRDALALTTASDVAQTYFSLVSTRQRVAMAEESLAASKQILGLLEVRLNVGTVGLLEVSQQRSSVAQAEASVATLKQQAATYQNALAILVGKAPQDFTVSATTLAGIATPEVPVSAPATLLERRPDLKVAEENLKAANADIGAARAAFFPTTSLSAGLVQGIDPAVTGISLGAALLAPIFTGGANTGQLQVANARQREVVADYRQAVLTSFAETGNALADLESANVRRASQTTAADSADTALRLARAQLDAGTTDLPTLLNTQTSQLSAQDAAVSAQADALNARVQLIRVMGGGWTQE